jgi:hypothetical protein
MLYPAKGTILAPNAICLSVNAVFFMFLKYWWAKILRK